MNDRTKVQRASACTSSRPPRPLVICRPQADSSDFPDRCYCLFIRVFVVVCICAYFCVLVCVCPSVWTCACVFLALLASIYYVQITKMRFEMKIHGE